jgi:hypothetical protein
MPKWFTFLGRRINTDRFLILHEAVEKALIDHLGLGYLHAHQHRAVRGLTVGRNHGSVRAQHNSSASALRRNIAF